MPSDRDLWNSTEWTARRSRYRKYEEEYKGTPLLKTQRRRDRDTGGDVKKYPLNLNMVKLGCDLHHMFTRGIPDHDDPLIVRAIVERGSSDRGEHVEDIINNGVWEPSHGGPIQQEAFLAANIYGGTVFQVTWEPWEEDLPYRIGIRPIKNPGYIRPIWDSRNPWRLVACYIGYEISKEEARAKYSVAPTDGYDKSLYMEYWSKDEFKIRVDGQVPVMKWSDRTWKLEGKNDFGFVPVYYIPHRRTVDLFGDSQVPGQTDLSLEINARATNVSDLVRSTRPGMLWGSDVDGQPVVREIIVEGNRIGYILDVGRTRPHAHANPPRISAMPIPDIPDSIVDYPQTLVEFWMMMAQISPAAFGMDDTKSGRITGPAIAQRMFLSIAHSTTERINFARGFTLMDRDIVRGLYNKQKAGAFKELEIPGPKLEESDRNLFIKQAWPPKLPMDRKEKHDEWIARLQSGGTDLLLYLTEMGVEDPEGVETRIYEYLRQIAKIEAEAAPQPSGDSNGDRGSDSSTPSAG